MEQLTVAIAEYNALRQEIIARLGYQSTAIFGCFSLIAIMIGLVAKEKKTLMEEFRWLFAATSVLYFMAGWFLLAQDRQIAEMGQYISAVLRPQIIQLIKGNSQWLLGWDTYIHSKDFVGTRWILSSVRAGSLYGSTYVPGFCLFGIYIYLTIKPLLLR